MMKKAYILGLLGIFMAFAKCSIAQQDPMFSQYMFNTLSINPAYAGSADMLEVNAIYRHQWVKFDGAPVTQTLVAHTPLKKESLSFGGSIINDRHGPVRQTGIYGDISYRIFMDKSKLSFGLKAGVNLFSANLQDLNTVVDADPTFQANVSNRTLPNFGAGVFWHSERYYIGFSVPKLLTNKLINSDLPDFKDNKERRHAFLTAGIVLDINNYLKFKPTLLVKAVDGAPISFDVTANFLLYEKFWIGAMYRFEDAMGVLLQYEVNGKIRVGYAYDYTFSDIGQYSNGSHEIMLGVVFGKRSGGDISPRYF
ncbi:MAG: type IX secretion system membrane protein PorP/SprF [Flavobacteriales bacterium]|nr:type IX secretion system membrane protein PorP/SprF [Flavobacteriales bacterium]